jgi:PAS domain S-box-containing protein
MATWSGQILRHLAAATEKSGPSQDLTAAAAGVRVLARVEASLAVLTRHCPVGLVHVSADGTVASANDRAALFLGLRSTLQGQGIEAVFPVGVAERTRAAVLATLADGAVRSVRIAADEFATHAALPLVVGVYRVELPSGEPGAVLVVETGDGDERSTTARYLDQERRYQAIFQRSTDAILLFDREHRCIDANPVAFRLLGLPNALGEVVRRDLWPAATRAQCENRIQRQIDGDTGNPIECDVVGPRGPVPVEVNALALGSRSYQVVLRSLEERRALERERRELDARGFQWEKMEALGRLAGAVVHDMNNILAAISNYASLIELSAVAEQREDAASILQACRRGKQLTGNLLRFTRGAPDVRVPTILQSVVAEAVEMLRRLLPRNVDVRTDLESGPLRLLADAGQLVQVIVNLGINAGHAMEATGGTIAITLRRTEHTAILSVADTGVGIPAENLHRVIEPFFTTRQNGTGLGLSSAYGTIKAHDGQLDVASTPGEGTVVTIELPLPSEVPVPSRPSMPPTRLFGEIRGAALVVDDDEDIRAGTVRLLRRIGLEASSEADGASALALLAARPVDLLVLDLDMPGLDGVTLLRELLERQPGARVLVASGYGRDYLPPELASTPTVRFLRKPFRFSDLERTVRELLTC